MGCQRLIPALVSPNSLLWGAGNSTWLSKFDVLKEHEKFLTVMFPWQQLFFFPVVFMIYLCYMKEKILSNLFCLISLSVPQKRHAYGVEDRFPSTDPGSYNGLFPNYSPFLLTFILSLHLGGACVTLVIHDIQWSKPGGGYCQYYIWDSL